MSEPKLEEPCHIERERGTQLVVMPLDRQESELIPSRMKIVSALVVGLVSLVMLSASARGDEPQKDERKGPLATLPSKLGVHIEKIKELGDNQWLNLGAPAADPRWGKARGSSWDAKALILAPDTPRRCQKFKVRPDRDVRWNLSTGESGKIIADSAGLITIAGLKLRPAATTVLTIVHLHLWCWLQRASVEDQAGRIDDQALVKPPASVPGTRQEFFPVSETFPTRCGYVFAKNHFPAF